MERLEPSGCSGLAANSLRLYSAGDLDQVRGVIMRRLFNYRNLVLSLPLLLANLSCEGPKGEYLITSLNPGPGRTIEILASYDVDGGRGIYYRVNVNGETVAPLSLMCVGLDTDKLKFKTITANNGDLVGVFEERYPLEILAMHDFKMNRTWPHDRIAHGQWGDELLRELQSAHSDRKFQLGEGSGCS